MISCGLNGHHPVIFFIIQQPIVSLSQQLSSRIFHNVLNYREDYSMDRTLLISMAVKLRWGGEMMKSYPSWESNQVPLIPTPDQWASCFTWGDLAFCRRGHIPSLSTVKLEKFTIDLDWCMVCHSVSSKWYLIILPVKSSRLHDGDSLER